jgi:hypothetical protein
VTRSYFIFLFFILEKFIIGMRGLDALFRGGRGSGGVSVYLSDGKGCDMDTFQGTYFGHAPCAIGSKKLNEPNGGELDRMMRRCREGNEK